MFERKIGAHSCVLLDDVIYCQPTYSCYAVAIINMVFRVFSAVRDSYNCWEAVRDSFNSSLFKGNILLEINGKLYLGGVTFGPPYYENPLTYSLADFSYLKVLSRFYLLSGTFIAGSSRLDVFYKHGLLKKICKFHSKRSASKSFFK